MCVASCRAPYGVEQGDDSLAILRVPAIGEISGAAARDAEDAGGQPGQITWTAVWAARAAAGPIYRIGAELRQIRGGNLSLASASSACPPGAARPSAGPTLSPTFWAGLPADSRPSLMGCCGRRSPGESLSA